MVMVTIGGKRDGELVVRTLVSRFTFALEQCRFSIGPSEQRTLSAPGCTMIPVSLFCFLHSISCRMFPKTRYPRVARIIWVTLS